MTTKITFSKLYCITLYVRISKRAMGYYKKVSIGL